METTSPIHTTSVEKLGAHADQTVAIRGWLHTKRSSGKVQFLIVRDGTGLVQAVVARSAVAPEVFDAADRLTHESSLVVTGRVRQDSRAPGGYELDVSQIEIVNLVPKDDPFPITPKEHGVEFLFDHRHLWLRSRRQHAILRIRHEIAKAARDFLDEDGFIACDAPILTPAACEGTTTLFEVEYFDRKAFLSQSGQLYNEATAAALGKVYCFGPAFRAEKSKTRRHLNEFWMIEPEMAFATLDDVMELSERFVSAIVQRVLERRGEELKVLERDVAKLERIVPPFPRISYDDAVKILQEAGSEIQWGGDFGGTDETILSERFDKPVMVHRYPSAVKAFYMAPDPANARVALCVDVIAPEGYGELVGGGERTASYELLVQRIRDHQLPEEAFTWYLDLRRYGSVPHAGFGMGLERAVAWICGLDHIREGVPFPRTLYRLTP
jgi:asparaginyl-tRNA synthetase